MLWLYAKLESSNLLLFKAAGDSIVDMNDLSEFKTQELSNIIWAYATAGESHPRLFSKFADHIVEMKDLGQFKPQELSNIVWAFATAGKSHPLLFQKLAVVGIERFNDFNPQNVANFLWAYATVGWLGAGDRSARVPASLHFHPNNLSVLLLPAGVDIRPPLALPATRCSC